MKFSGAPKLKPIVEEEHEEDASSPTSNASLLNLSEDQEPPTCTMHALELKTFQKGKSREKFKQAADEIASYWLRKELIDNHKTSEETEWSRLNCKQTLAEEFTLLTTKFTDSVISQVETLSSVKQLKCKTLNFLKEKSMFLETKFAGFKPVQRIGFLAGVNPR